MWRKLSPQMQAFLIILGVTAFLYCFWVYILAPQVQELQGAREELRLAAARLQKGRNIAGSLKREELLFKEAQKEVEALAVRFNTDVKDGLIFADVGLETARRDVTVTLLQPAEMVREEHYLELPFRFVVQGDYRQVMELVSKTENLINVSEVRRLDMKALVLAEDPNASPLEADGRVQADINITLYASPTAENRMRLDELSKWAVGRYNAYLAQGIKAPHPGIKAPTLYVKQAEPALGTGTATAAAPVKEPQDQTGEENMPAQSPA